MNADLRAAFGGAVAGGIATIPMSATMLAAERAGLMGAQPPALIAEKGLEAAGVDASTPEVTALALTGHLAFGAALGAAFGLVHRRLDPPGPAVARGVGYGLLVYAASYAGWIPAAGILPPPPHDRPGRQPSMIAAHVIFGAALGVLTNIFVGSARGPRSADQL